MQKIYEYQLQKLKSAQKLTQVKLRLMHAKRVVVLMNDFIKCLHNIEKSPKLTIKNSKIRIAQEACIIELLQNGSKNACKKMQNIKKVQINGIISESHKEQAKLFEIVIVKLLECSLTIQNE